MTEACKYWRQSSTTWMKDFFKAKRRELEFRDAAEFEARVAAKLAGAHAIKYCSRCPWNRMDPKDSFSCVHAYNMSFCFLRDARLEVEEEMDG